MPEREQINRSVRQLAPETKATKDDDDDDDDDNDDDADDDDDDDIKRRQKTRGFVFGTRWKGFNRSEELLRDRMRIDEASALWVETVSKRCVHFIQKKLFSMRLGVSE